MSRARVAVLQIVSNQLSVTEAAAEYGFSRRHLHRLLARYRQGGLDAVQQRSRRPKSSPHATPDVVRDRIVELRRQLTADGSDAGPVTIAWHLAREGLAEPSTSRSSTGWTTTPATYSQRPRTSPSPATTWWPSSSTSSAITARRPAP
jgi:hypothetical protein